MSKDSTKLPLKTQHEAVKPAKKNKLEFNFGSPIKVLAYAVLIFFFGQLVIPIIVAIPLLINSEIDRAEEVLSGINFMFTALIFGYLGMLALVYLAIGARKTSFKFIGLVRPKLQDVPIALLGLVAFWVIYLIIASIIFNLLPGIDTEQEQITGFEDAKTGLQLILTFFGLVVAAPSAEEILVRGYLYSGLRYSMKFIPAMLITSTLFAIAHLQLGGDTPPLWVAGINIFVLSIVLVYIREKTGRLLPCIYLHSLNNLIAFTYLFKDSLF